MLAEVQRGLETLYRLESELAVQDFLIDEAARNAAGVLRSPREQLLVQENDEDVFLGLFVDPAAIESVRSSSMKERVHGSAFGDFMLLVEGVSHFVYVAFKAGTQPVSALELELQAEVDKYITCLLSTESSPANSERVRQRLFSSFEYHDDLDEEERERYQVANDNALRYVRFLEKRFVVERRLVDMFAELRRFYRLSLKSKMERIRQAA